MSIRKDDSIQIVLNNIEKFESKAEIRDYLLRQWILESPQTKYRYVVEKLYDGNCIYLERPGQLNKGCDFVIFAENQFLFKNENDRPPKHDVILQDLREKKALFSSSDFSKLLKALELIYECKSYDKAVNKLSSVSINYGLSFELILKLSRWMFIEQDITYWAKSGREMLYKAILSI